MHASSVDLVGHIIAGDPKSGLAYVQPARGIIDDIEKQLQCTASISRTQSWPQLQDIPSQWGVVYHAKPEMAEKVNAMGERTENYSSTDRANHVLKPVDTTPSSAFAEGPSSPATNFPSLKLTHLEQNITAPNNTYFEEPIPLLNHSEDSVSSRTSLRSLDLQRAGSDSDVYLSTEKPTKEKLRSQKAFANTSSRRLSAARGLYHKREKHLRKGGLVTLTHRRMTTKGFPATAKRCPLILASLKHPKSNVLPP